MTKQEIVGASRKYTKNLDQIEVVHYWNNKVNKKHTTIEPALQSAFVAGAESREPEIQVLKRKLRGLES